MIALGHSTTPIELFLEGLNACGVRTLADIRTVPRSRRNPQFEQENLRASLEGAGIHYAWMKELGGFRKPQPDSVNTGWRNSSFRGYADYMQTPQFEAALQALLALGPAETTAFLCSELLPWHCHRSLVADALVARGVPVEQVMITPKGIDRKPHKMAAFAVVREGKVTYPPEQTPLPISS